MAEGRDRQNLRSRFQYQREVATEKTRSHYDRPTSKEIADFFDSFTLLHSEAH